MEGPVATILTSRSRSDLVKGTRHDSAPSVPSVLRKKKKKGDNSQLLHSAPRLSTAISNAPKKVKDVSFLCTFLCDSPFMTKVLMSMFLEENNEELPVSLAWIFVVNNKGPRLVKFCIQSEILKTMDYTLLLREENAYVRVLSCFIQLEGYYYIKTVIGKVLKKIANPKTGDIEIDENRADPKSDIAKNRSNFIKVCKEMMETLLKSSSSVPVAIKSMLHLAHESAMEKFEADSYKVLGSCFFLRFVCPNMVQPEKHGLLKDVSRETRRRLVLCSKVLQLVANETEPTEKEQYMVEAGLGPFVTGSIKKLHKFYDKLVKLKGAKPFPNQISVLPSAELYNVYIEGHSLDIFHFIEENREAIAAAAALKGYEPEEIKTQMNQLEGSIIDCYNKRATTRSSSLSIKNTCLM